MSRLDDYDEILSVRQVADVLGIARNSVYQAAAAGQIPSVRVGRRILFARRSLEAWLSAGALEAPHGMDATNAAGEYRQPLHRTWRESRLERRMRR
jgi:excisionase family DNA binding protein